MRNFVHTREHYLYLDNTSHFHILEVYDKMMLKLSK